MAALRWYFTCLVLEDNTVTFASTGRLQWAESWQSVFPVFVTVVLTCAGLDQGLLFNKLVCVCVCVCVCVSVCVSVREVSPVGENDVT